MLSLWSMRLHRIHKQLGLLIGLFLTIIYSSVSGFASGPLSPICPGAMESVIFEREADFQKAFELQSHQDLKFLKDLQNKPAQTYFELRESARNALKAGHIDFVSNFRELCQAIS